VAGCPDDRVFPARPCRARPTDNGRNTPLQPDRNMACRRVALILPEGLADGAATGRQTPAIWRGPWNVRDAELGDAVQAPLSTRDE